MVGTDDLAFRCRVVAVTAIPSRLRRVGGGWRVSLPCVAMACSDGLSPIWGFDPSTMSGTEVMTFLRFVVAITSCPLRRSRVDFCILLPEARLVRGKLYRIRWLPNGSTMIGAKDLAAD